MLSSCCLPLLSLGCARWCRKLRFFYVLICTAFRNRIFIQNVLNPFCIRRRCQLFLQDLLFLQFLCRNFCIIFQRILPLLVSLFCFILNSRLNKAVSATALMTSYVVIQFCNSVAACINSIKTIQPLILKTFIIISSCIESIETSIALITGSCIYITSVFSQFTSPVTDIN